MLRPLGSLYFPLLGSVAMPSGHPADLQRHDLVRNAVALRDHHFLLILAAAVLEIATDLGGCVYGGRDNYDCCGNCYSCGQRFLHAEFMLFHMRFLHLAPEFLLPAGVAFRKDMGLCIRCKGIVYNFIPFGFVIRKRVVFHSKYPLSFSEAPSWHVQSVFLQQPPGWRAARQFPGKTALLRTA